MHARYVMTVDGADTVKENHAVVVEDGRIKAILPSDEARSVYRGATHAPCSITVQHHRDASARHRTSHRLSSPCSLQRTRWWSAPTT